MVTWKTDVDTIPLHTVLIVSDRPENVAIWDALLTRETVLSCLNPMSLMPCKAHG